MFNYVQAFVRYATENEANTAWEKAQGEAEDGKVKMGEKELTATVLEGMKSYMEFQFSGLAQNCLIQGIKYMYISKF